MTSNLTRIAETIANTEKTSKDVLAVAGGLNTQSQTLDKDVGAYLKNIESC